jgi:hypothetical protein
MDMVKVLAERPPRPREYPAGLPYVDCHEQWEADLRRLRRGYRPTPPHFRGGGITLSHPGAVERPEIEVRMEFLDLLEARFAPECANALRRHVLDGIPIEVAATNAGIGRRKALRELERLREMYR